MTALQTPYRNSGDDAEPVPSHVHFAPCVSIIPIPSRWQEDDAGIVGTRGGSIGSDTDTDSRADQASSCPMQLSCLSPVRSTRPQLRRSDALEPDFLERQATAKAGAARRRRMLRRSNAFESY
ncbi:expressed unknown protein [Seminavis robusta]|uniref:Uncharacterized protein n=1 Tax=Seminavis robusta TaxID=568900 RepID=A0A9N8EHX7_9STRA|nr:expressed unknown protein [Seminavis robusta]|eukprot:Sro980_g227460.1 n/a (123) ;mRNA; f:36594-36962